MVEQTDINLSDAGTSPAAVESSPPPPVPAGQTSSARQPRGWRVYLERYAVLLILLLVVIVFSILEPDSFATKDNAISILQQQSVLACLALGLLVPIAIGEFDLSVGYVLGFSAMVAAKLGGTTGIPGLPIILICLGIGLTIGALNGVLVAKFKVHSLIATLGVGFAVSGATIGVSGSQTLFAGIPDAITKVSSTEILTVDLAVWIVLALAIVMWLILVHTPFGRRIYAIGGSERVARLAGVRTDAIKIAAFAIAGLFAAVAGLLQLGEAGAANPSGGISLLLPAFAAIFLGATTIKPGYFNVWGTIIAILLLAAGFTGLGLRGVPLWVEPIFDGTVLLVAVLFARAEARSLGRAT
jgi:ribose transport system permease protein